MSQRPEKEKRQYPTAGQKIRLAQLLEADEELRSGKFTAAFTKKMSSERWDRIAQQLNSYNGANKTGKEWRTVSTMQLSLPDLGSFATSQVQVLWYLRCYVDVDTFEIHLS